MASHTIADTGSGISVGSVFGRSIAVIRANPVATLGVAFVLIALPQLILGQLGGRAAMFQDFRSGLYAAAGLYLVVVGLLWLVASGAIVQATVAHDQGRAADLREVLQVGVRRCLPLLAVYILFVIGVGIGWVLFLVPGIMLGVMWAVALPAIVTERPGVFGAFGRSRALTKGARWQVFGILLLALVIYLLVSIVVGVVGVAGYGSLGALTARGAVPVRVPPPSLLLQLLQSIVTTVMLTWYTTVGAALFVELRHWKDGPDADRLADIFA